VEELGLGPVGVVGMSMGGCTGLSLAARHPAMVDRLVLADTTSCYGVDRVERWQERAEVALRKARSDQGAFQLDRWFSDAFRAADPEECQRVLEIFIGTDSRAHAAACAALGAFDGTALMPLVEADTWVLVGEQDYATPPAMAETLAGGIPHARLQVLAETRHLSLVERSDVWPLLEAYLGGAR
jgi:3-oxoadipate enol-lactonase